MQQLRSWFYDLAALASLLGFGILKLLDYVPSYVLAFTAGAVVCFLFLSGHLRLGQKVRGYENVAKLCHNVLSHVKQEIWILAGDVSWIQRDEKLLRELISKGVKVYLVCEQPKCEEDVRNVDIAKKIVSILKHYPHGIESTKALILEPRNRHMGGLVLIEKQRKPAATTLLTASATDKDALAVYSATMLSADQEPFFFDAIVGLFRSLWFLDNPR